MALNFHRMVHKIKPKRVGAHRLTDPGIEIRGLEITEELYKRIRDYSYKSGFITTHFDHGHGKINDKTNQYTLQARYDPKASAQDRRYFIWNGGRSTGSGGGFGTGLNYEAMAKTPTFDAVCGTIIRRHRDQIVAGYIYEATYE